MHQPLADFEKLKALRRFKAVCGPHSRCERYQLSRDLAAIRPSSSGLQGSAHYLRRSRNRRNFYQSLEAFRVMLATGVARSVQHATRSAAPRGRCLDEPCLRSVARQQYENIRSRSTLSYISAGQAIPTQLSTVSDSSPTGQSIGFPRGPLTGSFQPSTPSFPESICISFSFHSTFQRALSGYFGSVYSSRDS